MAETPLPFRVHLSDGTFCVVRAVSPDDARKQVAPWAKTNGLKITKTKRDRKVGT